jgi:hypothetical protein
MSEPNPYAPPKVDESEAPSAIYWQCYGERVLARNGAMLPKVDLETGASDDEMTSVARSYQAAGAGHVFKIAMFVGIYFFAQALFENDSEWLLWTLVGASIVMGWLGRLRGGQTGAITIWEFRETVRERRRQIRRKIRIGLLAGSFLLMILGPSLLLSSGPFHAAWVLRLITTGLVLLLANALWAMFDRPSTRSESGPDGWLRIRKVHPAAMAKLRKIEAEQQQQAATAAPHRKRLVRTSYYHKYPLASLLGTRRINPLQILVIALMKLLRSKRLERETFHFSEAAEIPEANLSDSLQQKIQSWRARHPDWPLLQANRLPSPPAISLSNPPPSFPPASNTASTSSTPGWSRNPPPAPACSSSTPSSSRAGKSTPPTCSSSNSPAPTSTPHASRAARKRCSAPT